MIYSTWKFSFSKVRVFLKLEDGKDIILNTCLCSEGEEELIKQLSSQVSTLGMVESEVMKGHDYLLPESQLCELLNYNPPYLVPAKPSEDFSEG